MKLKVLDLFSGIGGFSLGLERTGGFETVAFCEIDPFCRAVLAKHWPNVRQYEDVRTLTADALARDGIAVDVICGGFPCQDISTAGRGAGIGGERSGLWTEYARIIGELRPQFVIVENVAALLGRGLDVVLGHLAALGFDAEWHCIPASAVGAPHRRDRVWIVAYPNGGRRWADLAGGDDADREDARGAETNRVSGKICKADGAGPMAHPDSERELQPEGLEQDKRRRPGDGGSHVADTKRGGQPRQGQPFISGSKAPLVNRQAIRVGNIWSVEPDVGGSPDGFPTFMDRYVCRGLSYEASRRAVQVLRNVWSEHVSKTLRRTIGGFDRLQQAEVLFAFVREYEGGTHEARILVEGQEASKSFLRSLRSVAKLQAHHIDQDRTNNEPENIQTLCKFCHDFWHSMARRLGREVAGKMPPLA